MNTQVRDVLTPIPTVCNGVKFRSRAEARWAMLFDTLGVEWQYEAEGFQLSTCWYLPDFWLPRLTAFAEVKGSAHQWDIHCEIKASDLVKESGLSLVICDEVSISGLIPKALVRDRSLPWGYDEYWCNLPESALRERLWLEKEAPSDWSRDTLEMNWQLAQRVDAIRRHRFYGR